MIHDNESTWLAKWHDQLTNKDKYVWLSDTSTIRQEQDRAKYEKAINLQKSIIKIRKHIENNLGSKDEKIQKTATVAYLIDNLAMRVGDEKDEDEADTVGATTLRVEHITISGNKVEFDFLGKDSVRWKKTIEGDKQFVKNIKDFIKGKKPSEAI
ncbi:MAG: DNA topoisomerase I, partial [Nitrososphaerales archaeon]|nr:DNA topoisomerase I [Nitrososphaerales archaeon]